MHKRHFGQNKVVAFWWVKRWKYWEHNAKCHVHSVQCVSIHIIWHNVTQRFVRISCGRCFLRFIDFFYAKGFLLDTLVYFVWSFFCSLSLSIKNAFTKFSYHHVIYMEQQKENGKNLKKNVPNDLMANSFVQ